ncbi:MAG: hypothetical protein HRT45_06140 [Bdellovibrionales bacterium]|nr:hypothetical protein [Bdellovibrionales bacterium]
MKNSFLKILGFNCSLIALVFICVEAYLAASDSKVPDNVFFESQSCYDHSDKRVGYKPKANCQNTTKRTYDGDVIYEVKLLFDEHGRRTGPADSSKETEPSKAGIEVKDQNHGFVVLLGDSNTFGEGLSFKASLAGHLSAQTESEVLNYAVPGYGLNHILAQAESGRFEKEIEQDSGYFLLLLNENLVERIVGDWDYLIYSYHSPKYGWGSDGKLEYKGSFIEESPISTRLIRLLAKSKLAERIWWTYLSPGNRFLGKERKRLVCQAHKQLNQQLKAQKPKAKLVVVLSIKANEMPDNYLDCLAGEGIEVLNFSRHPKFQDHNRAKIAPGKENHFNSDYNKALSNQIANWFSQQN